MIAIQKCWHFHPSDSLWDLTCEFVAGPIIHNSQFEHGEPNSYEDAALGGPCSRSGVLFPRHLLVEGEYGLTGIPFHRDVPEELDLSWLQ